MARPQPRNSRPPPFLRPSLTRRVRAAPGECVSRLARCARGAHQLARRARIARQRVCSRRVHDVSSQCRTGALGSRDAERELRPLLLSWRDKLSDSNGRVREAAEGALLALCSLPAIGPSAVGALLVAPLPPAKRNSSQAWLGRLAPLQRLLREHGPQVVEMSDKDHDPSKTRVRNTSMTCLAGARAVRPSFAARQGGARLCLGTGVAIFRPHLGRTSAAPRLNLGAGAR